MICKGPSNSNHSMIHSLFFFLHTAYPEDLCRRILRHILGWSWQIPYSLAPTISSTLITLPWITERMKTAHLADLIWLTHDPAQCSIPCRRLAEPLNTTVQGMGNPPFPVIQQCFYGQLWTRGAPRWLQLHRERKVSAESVFSSMGEL